MVVPETPLMDRRVEHQPRALPIRYRQPAALILIFQSLKQDISCYFIFLIARK